MRSDDSGRRERTRPGFLVCVFERLVPQLLGQHKRLAVVPWLPRLPSLLTRTLLHWCPNPGRGSRHATMQPAQPTPLAELVKSLAGLHQAQHQALMDMKLEQEDRFRLRMKTHWSHWSVRLAARLRCLLEKVHKSLRVVVWTHLHQQDVGDRWGCDGVILQAKQAPDGPPVFILRLDHEPEVILLLLLHVHQRLMLSLMKTSKFLRGTRDRWVVQVSIITNYSPPHSPQ